MGVNLYILDDEVKKGEMCFGGKRLLEFMQISLSFFYDIMLWGLILIFEYVLYNCLYFQVFFCVIGYFKIR